MNSFIMPLLLKHLSAGEYRDVVPMGKDSFVAAAVNSVLAMVSLSSGRHWAVYPALGWGLGLLLHGVGVWIALGGGGLQARLVAQERERLSRERQGL